MPITTGSALREALAVFGRHWWRYVLLYAAVLLPLIFAPLLIPSPWGPLLGLVLLIALPLGQGAIAFSVLNASDARGLGLSAYVRIAPRSVRLVVAGVVHMIVVTLGFLLFVVPGLLLAAMWSVFIPWSSPNEVLGWG